MARTSPSSRAASPSSDSGRRYVIRQEDVSALHELLAQVETLDDPRPTGWPPRYAAEVRALIRHLSTSEWMSSTYDPAAMESVFARLDEGSGTLEDVRACLTWAVRGERFSDGFWGIVLASGRLRSTVEHCRSLMRR